MNAEQQDAWQRAEDHTWRAMYVVTVNIVFLAVVAILARIAGQITMGQLALGVPTVIIFALLAWGVGKRHSRVAAAILVAYSAVPFGARIYQHAWGSAIISALFLGLYALAFYGTIVMHRLRNLDKAANRSSGAGSAPQRA
jgi:hypothetical protein